MTALAKKYYCSGHHKVTEKEQDQRTRAKETWRKKCGQQVSNAAAWRKMKVAAKDRAGLNEVVCGLRFTVSYITYMYVSHKKPSCIRRNGAMLKIRPMLLFRQVKSTIFCEAVTAVLNHNNKNYTIAFLSLNFLSR